MMPGEVGRIGQAGKTGKDGIAIPIGEDGTARGKDGPGEDEHEKETLVDVLWPSNK